MKCLTVSLSRRVKNKATK